MSGRPFVATFDESTSTLSLSGIVDELSIEEMKASVAAASVDSTGPLVVDLSDVDFLPSIGLGILAGAIRRARAAGGQVTLATRAGSLAQRVLEVSGLPFELRAGA